MNEPQMCGAWVMPPELPARRFRALVPHYDSSRGGWYELEEREEPIEQQGPVRCPALLTDSGACHNAAAHIDPTLPPAAAAPLAAELLVQHAADRAAAPDPEDVVRLMRENGALPDLDVQWPE